MIQLTGTHLAAVGRRRRIIDQMDGLTPIDLLGIPMQDYVDLRFHHADLDGSQIDGFIWDVGDGEDAFALYPTEALPLLDDPGLNRWREQGVDFVGTLVDETRRRGLEVFWNSRVAPVDPAQPSLGQPLTDPARRNWLKEEHPDWVQRCWWWNGLYDLSSPGLREHKVAVLRELLARYAFDGLQLDFSRHQPTLPIGRQWQHREDATAYVRVREMTLEMEARSGRPILLAVKVPETVAGCAIDGLDLATWARAAGRHLRDRLAHAHRRRRRLPQHRRHARRPPLHGRLLQPVAGGLPWRLLQLLGAGRGLRDRLQLAHRTRGALHPPGLPGRRARRPGSGVRRGGDPYLTPTDPVPRYWTYSRNRR